RMPDPPRRLRPTHAARPGAAATPGRARRVPGGALQPASGGRCRGASPSRPRDRGRPSPRRRARSPLRPPRRAARTSRRATCEDAAVEDAAGDHRDAAPETDRQQLLAGARVEERVATGDQEAVEIALAREAAQELRLVHPDTDRADGALAAQPLEGRIGPADRL